MHRTHHRLALCAVLTGAVSSWAGPAAAQPAVPPQPPPEGPPDEVADPPISAPKEAPDLPSLNLPPGEKRPEQDYDQRDLPPSAGEVLLWIPRVTFFPVYLATEYLLRKPLGALTIAAERGDWIQEISEFFTFGPENNIGIVPTAFVDFGFHPSVGLYVFYDDFLARDNDLRISPGFGGARWLKLTIADRVQLDPDTHIKFEARGLNRPDLLFWGIGTDTLSENESTYELGFVGGEVLFHTEFNEGSFFEVYTSADATRFDNVECSSIYPGIDPTGGSTTLVCDDPGLETAAALGLYDVPPGFEEGYVALRQGGRIALDSRDPRPQPGSGVAAEAKLEHAFDLESAEIGRWITYGGSIAGFVDITGRQRVVSLSVSTEFADPLTDGYQIPFTELVGNQLGSPSGSEIMRGFRPGRLIGRSAAVAKLEYEYPIWAFLDGTLQLATGNVFGEHLDGFELEKLRLSFAAGIRSISLRDHSFNLLVGTGTETFDQGAELSGLRFVLGGTTGF